MTLAGLRGIRTETESVAVRAAGQQRPRRRRLAGNSSRAFAKPSAHLVHRLVSRLQSVDSAPLDMARIDDAQNGVHGPIHAQDAVADRERIEDAHVLDVQ